MNYPTLFNGSFQIEPMGALRRSMMTRALGGQVTISGELVTICTDDG